MRNLNSDYITFLIDIFYGIFYCKSTKMMHVYY